jgi:transcriptional regulator with XRE-family HTH domain
MTPSHLAHALTALASRRGLTLTELADQAKLSQGTLSRLASRDQRPDVQSLQALCMKQPDPRDGLELLLAHLRDEVDRAGRLQTEVTITADGQDTPDDIRLLAAQAQSDPEMRAILHDLAQLVRVIHRRIARGEYVQFVSPELRAAEDKAK